MIATTEQRIPWLRGEHRSAGAAGGVAARDQPRLPRRPLARESSEDDSEESGSDSGNE